MSGGIAQLVAVGAQDAHLVGQPEVSFFRSTYKRATNFSQSCERQVIQGNIQNNGMSSIRFERKGDMLSYVYLAPIHSNGTQSATVTDWASKISKVELFVGGQLIDEQDSTFSTMIAPELLSTSSSKSVGGGIFRGGADEQFYPLRFQFCENWQSALPLIAMQYHDVELRIHWGASAASNKWEAYANYIFLDTDERTVLSSKPMNLLITQTQKVIASQAKVQELSFNHPVKFLASNCSANGMMTATNKTKLQINGTDCSDYKFTMPNYSAVSSYYHVANSTGDKKSSLFIYPFCLETAKLQPTGSLNFSRLDSARIVNSGSSSLDAIYAVNYNIMRIENGMAGLVYAN